jgi:glycosyltransferase involved in cell wall biosynthesis
MQLRLPVPVTVVIPTLNEADRIAGCLTALRWAAEVIVADAGSTDGTIAIAQRMGARVLEGTGPTIGAQRNAAIAAASYEWILAVDADEAVTPALAQSVRDAIVAPTHDAFWISLQNYYLGEPMTRGSWARDRHIRLFRRAYTYCDDAVHEKLQFSGVAGTLDGTLAHEPYRDLTHQMEKATRYARWGAADLHRRGKRASLVMDLLVRPWWRFVKFYVVQGHWRMGRLGLVFSVIHGWAGFSKYAQLWYLEHAERRRPAPLVSRDGGPRVAGDGIRSATAA